MATESTKRIFWRKAIADQQASGLSIRQYCKQRKLNEPSFYSWRRELSKEGSPTFMPLQFPIQTSTALEIVLGDVTLRLPVDVDPSLLRRIVEALR